MPEAANKERFTGRVEVYERYRMRFPASVLSMIRKRCGLQPQDLVADIGAGTGMLTEVFLEAGNAVIAVEPNAEMRAACEHLITRYPQLSVVDAAAEATGLPAASIDLVSVGRAFHWFDQPRAIAEFTRILKPGGWVVLVSNRRAPTGSEQRHELEQILRDHGTDYDRAHTQARDTVMLETLEGEHFRIEVPGQQSISLAQLAGQTESYSFAPKPGDPSYPAMQQALGEYFAKWSVDSRITMDTTCEVAGWRGRT